VVVPHALSGKEHDLRAHHISIRSGVSSRELLDLLRLFRREADADATLVLEPTTRLPLSSATRGDVQLKPSRYSTIESLRGAAGSLKKPVSKAKMLEIVHEEGTAGKLHPDR
jgi:hypothetical protein